ncbi:hypothetical protein BD626DRAFT_410432 [Schizophyllum amplum]|uniref:Uncharacterized protein n=1 Tax=Schizophyllum amplum TaxID=97359 RepID=A0A550BUV0_9AGAR|nr:hypothetical protein BD626DRAFT_414327 [Auriculariopsis ampla]TRM58501.1 hypothetical protein BD626DRAFT_410432 [Auriculariopsis ampla]
MARRSAPPNSGPAYIGRIPVTAADADESALSRFVREEITAPEKIAGNLSILTGVTVFLAGIFAVRRWGDLMVPV